MAYVFSMGRTNIEIDESLVRKARKLTRLKTKREIVEAALELLVRSESRKGILRHYGTGIWKGDLKTMRSTRNSAEDQRSKKNITPRGAGGRRRRPDRVGVDTVHKD
jgi:Arc/MetJ family transcription regulator